MNEILLLYLLLKGKNTMYGLSKLCTKYFGFIIKPSYGAVQPALKKLEKNKYITSEKFITEGGKPYFYYSITEDGTKHLKEKLLSKLHASPVQMYPSVKVRIICSDILNAEEQKELFTLLKTQLLKIQQTANNTLTSDIYNDNCKAKMVLDNTVCEYKNTIDMIERFENACNR